MRRGLSAPLSCQAPAAFRNCLPYLWPLRISTNRRSIHAKPLSPVASLDSYWLTRPNGRTNVQCTHQTHHSRCCKACRLRPLPEMCEATHNELDVETPTGNERAYINGLCNAYLRRQGPPEAPTRGFYIVYQTLARLYKQTCPILLLWRIWWQDASAALACASVRCPPPQAGSKSHRAVAAWTCVRWRDRKSLCSVCLPIYLEECTEGPGGHSFNKMFSEARDRHEQAKGDRCRASVKSP